MLSLVEEHAGLNTKKEKSLFFELNARKLLMKESIFKDRFYRFKADLFKEASRKNRSDRNISRRDIQHDRFIEDIKTIASVCVASSLNERNDFKFFRNRKFNSVEIATEICWMKGLIQEKYPVTTVRRWIQKLGLNFISFFRELAALHLQAEHSNHVFLIDATPIQSIYLNRKGSLIYDPSLGTDKNHADDRIRQRDLRKVWLYFVVDKFSGAFLVRVYAGENLGENEHHWVETLQYAMMPKEDIRIPMAGIPLNLYADGGALKGDFLKKVCRYFDILAVSHAPGNSRATGGVEARIGAFKKTIETLFNSAVKPSDFHNDRLESLTHFITEWSVRTNLKNGLFNRYLEGIRIREEVSERHFLEAGFDTEYRKTNGYGEVSIDGKQYFVHIDCKDMNVEIIRKYPDLFYAKDIFGTVHECRSDLNTSKMFEEKADAGNSRFRDIQEEVVAKARNFKLGTSVEELLPSNIFALRSEKRDEFAVEKAWTSLLEITGTSEEEIPEDTKILFTGFFQSALETNDRITEENLQKAVWLLKNHLNDIQEKNKEIV